jgi:hypothetical protein
MAATGTAQLPRALTASHTRGTFEGRYWNVIATGSSAASACQQAEQTVVGGWLPTSLLAGGASVKLSSAIPKSILNQRGGSVGQESPQQARPAAGSFEGSGTPGDEGPIDLPRPHPFLACVTA